MIVERLDEVQRKFNQKSVSLIVMFIFLVIGVVLVMVEINGDRIAMETSLTNRHEIISNEIMLKNLIVEYQLAKMVDHRNVDFKYPDSGLFDPDFVPVKNSDYLIGVAKDNFDQNIYVFGDKRDTEMGVTMTEDINNVLGFVRTMGDLDLDGYYYYRSTQYDYVIIYPLGEKVGSINSDVDKLNQIAGDFLDLDQRFTNSTIKDGVLYRWSKFINDRFVEYAGFSITNLSEFVDDESLQFMEVAILTSEGQYNVHGRAFENRSVLSSQVGVSYEMHSEVVDNYIYYDRRIGNDMTYIGRTSNNLIFLESIAGNSSFILIVTLAFFVMVLAYLFLLRYKKYLDLEVQSNEQELKKTLYKSRLGYVMNTISEAFIRADEDFKIIEVNQAAADMLGYQIVDILGRRLEDFIYHPEDLSIAQDEGLYHRYEINFKHKSGRLIHCLVNQSTIIKDSHYHCEHYIMVTDITPLMEAQQKAEEANRSKSRFIANLSHEIRTPMNATIGYIYLLEQTKLNDNQKKYLDKMDYASNSLLEIIDEILDFSKIEADSVIVENVSFSLIKVITNALSMFDTEAYRKRIDYEINFDDKLPDIVTGDPYRIRQIVVNLLSNAFKFTSKGHISVNLYPLQFEYVNASEGNIWVRIVVEDTGIGIPDDRMESLFEPFVQADESTTRLYGGTGLGLAICKRLVTLMNGKITAKSIVGQGSAFFVDLPLKPAETTVIEEGIVSESLLIKHQNNKKILIVEDNPLNQELLIELCRQEGNKVVVANNGKVAARIITSQHTKKFDLILMDIQMPIQDGYVTTDFIRKHSEYKNTPIIAVTANADRETQMRIHESGMNGYVLKPISAVELYSKISSYL